MSKEERREKKVLLYLGKFPGYGFDVDGGSILARQLIDSLKHNCNLTVVFIRKRGETYTDPFVNEIRYEEYKNPFGNKFERRLQNLDTNRAAIGNFMQYDIIITAHVSKFFGFEDAPSDFWNKTILFPMFCTSSYQRAGENVPLEYTNKERFVFEKVQKIITPSESELNDLIADYNVDFEKISVVYRGINPQFRHIYKKQNMEQPQIVCIGSIKKQKNNMAALELLNKLGKKGVNASVIFVGTIQDQSIYEQMLGFIKKFHLSQKVHFFFEQSQEHVAKIVQKSDVNISVSNWETFGRGIFEGISCGLPTFVFSRLTGVRKICQGNPGVCFVDTIEEMALEIERVVRSPIIYHQMSDSLKGLAEKVSYKRESTALINIILNS